MLILSFIHRYISTPVASRGMLVCPFEFVDDKIPSLAQILRWPASESQSLKFKLTFFSLLLRPLITVQSQNPSTMDNKDNSCTGWGQGQTNHQHGKLISRRRVLLGGWGCKMRSNWPNQSPSLRSNILPPSHSITASPHHFPSRESLSPSWKPFRHLINQAQVSVRRALGKPPR